MVSCLALEGIFILTLWSNYARLERLFLCLPQYVDVLVRK